MIDQIQTCVDFCSLAAQGTNFLAKKVGEIFLNEDEKEILKAASKSGQIHLPSYSQVGVFLLIGERQFFDANDPAVQANYLEAFSNLCRKGFIEYHGGILFKLNGTGFKKARSLAN